MQRKAQQILSDLVPRRDRYGNERAHYVHRVAMCYRGTDGGDVVVKRSPDHMHADFEGVQTCGSVWHCPICAPKIAAERRDEMNKALHGHVAAGGGVAFVTYTFQHGREDSGAGELKAQSRRLARAQSGFKGSKRYRRFMATTGFVGAVKASEVTYGEMNGWHPHAHELVFGAKGQLRRLRAVLPNLWARWLIKCGMAGFDALDTRLERAKKLRDLRRRCCVVRDGSYAAEYVAKFGKEPVTLAGGRWGIGSEMTQAHLKRQQPGRTEHCSAWRLLLDACDGDLRSSELWREFALAMKGTAQLYWSKGLKRRFGIDEHSDDELAADPEKRCTEVVMQLGPLDWTAVISHDARWQVRYTAATEGRAGVVALLDRLRRQPATHSGVYTETSSIFARPRSRGGGEQSEEVV